MSITDSPKLTTRIIQTIGNPAKEGKLHKSFKYSALGHKNILCGYVLLPSKASKCGM